MIIDIHTHTTPEVDDGSKSMEMSMQMLRSIVDQGCDRIIATPHSEAFGGGDHERGGRSFELRRRDCRDGQG